MNFSLKSIAVAVTLAVAAAGANAAIDNGAGGNGELFFNAWDANGSYTFDLNITIDAFETQLAAGNFALTPVALTGFSGFDSASLQWNIVAADIDGDNRLLTTFTAPAPASAIRNGNGRTATAQVTNFALEVNALNTTNADFIRVTSNTDPAYAGKDAFGSGLNSLLNFSNAGTLDNNSYASGLSFMRADFLVAGTARGVYTPYLDGSTDVKVWLNGTTLNMAAVAAVPEPSEYAMLLAGLGMIGFMARRNKRA